MIAFPPSVLNNSTHSFPQTDQQFSQGGYLRCGLLRQALYRQQHEQVKQRMMATTNTTKIEMPIAINVPLKNIENASCPS